LERTSVSVISSACSPDQQLVGVDAKLFGVDRIQRVLGVDERGDAAQALRLRYHMERERGLA